MGKTLSLINAIILVAVIGLSFLNRSKLTETKESLARATTELNSSRNDLVKTKQEVSDVSDKLKKSEATQSELSEEIAGLEQKLSAAESEKLAIAEKRKEAEDKIAELERQISSSLGDDGTGIGDLQQKIAELQFQLNSKDEEIESLQGEVGVLEEKIEGKDKRISSLQKAQQERTEAIARNGLEIPVQAVNAEWGFVVLGGGDKQGVTPGTDFVVMRGTQNIAQVRVSSIEPSIAIADILPWSINEGARIQAGDRAIIKNLNQ